MVAEGDANLVQSLCCPQLQEETSMVWMVRELGVGVRGSSCEPPILELGKEGFGLPRRAWTLCMQELGRGSLTRRECICACFKATVTQQQPPVASSCPCPKLSSPSVNSSV